MTQTITVAQAQKQFGSYLTKVFSKKDKFIIEQKGEPIAALVSIDELEDLLEINNPKIRAEMQTTEGELYKGEYITLDLF